jgi:hypothetical protein
LFVVGLPRSYGYPEPGFPIRVVDCFLRWCSRVWRRMSSQNSGVSCDAFNDDGCVGVPCGFGYHTPDDLATRLDVIHLLILVLGFPCTYLQTKLVIDCLYLRS